MLNFWLIATRILSVDIKWNPHLKKYPSIYLSIYLFKSKIFGLAENMMERGKRKIVTFLKG